jgi:hypothetical protein
MLKRLLTIVLMFSVLAACKQTVAPDAKTALELFCAHKACTRRNPRLLTSIGPASTIWKLTI